MTDVDMPIEWFLREDVKQEIEDKARCIARLAIKLGVDYVNDLDAIADCIEAFMPLDGLTAEEYAYAAELSISICSYESLVDKGFLTYADDGYVLTEAGRQRQLMLQTEGTQH